MNQLIQRNNCCCSLNYRIEDDLDKFLQVEPKPQKKAPVVDHQTSEDTKPIQKPKPSPRAKPSLPKKPVLGATNKPDVVSKKNQFHSHSCR